MIPMSCPSCGRRGTVPPDRLNTRMHCKKCDAVFYMDSGGRITLGEPPAGKKGRAKSAASEDPYDVFGKLGKLPKGIWYTLGLVIVGYIGWAFVLPIVAWLFKSSAPEGLNDLTVYVGEAFADSRVSDLRAVAASETANDVERWFKDNRKFFGEFGPQVPGNDVVINVTLGAESANAADSKAVLLPPKDKDEEGNPQPSLTLTLPWVKEGGLWRLDGKQVLNFGVQQNRTVR